MSHRSPRSQLPTRERERLPEVMACCDLCLISLVHDSLLSPGDAPPAEIPIKTSVSALV